MLKLGATHHKTAKQSGTCPVWGEVFEYHIDIPDAQKLEIEIFDSDKLSEDDFLGSAVVAVGDAVEKGVGESWYDLAGAGEGEGLLHLETAWLTTCTDVRYGKSSNLNLYLLI